jgi:hypothetical protein
MSQMLIPLNSSYIRAIESLIKERSERIHPTPEDEQLEPYQFTNQAIKEKLIEITEAEAVEDPDKKRMYYSPEIGAFGQSKITYIIKSKFKVNFDSVRIGNKTHRCVEFKLEYLDRIKASFNISDKIRIIKPKSKGQSKTDTDPNQNQNVTPITPVTPLGGVEGINEEGEKGNNIPNNVNITKI